MVIYNFNELNSKYMKKDQVVVEIHSQLSIEELLTMLRNGENITPDIANITAYSIWSGEMITEAEYDSEVQPDALGYNAVINEEDLSAYRDSVSHINRPELFIGYEAYQFNRPMFEYPFAPCEITREQLMIQLYAALEIMPTIKDIPELSIQELKKMSAIGDRLYWNFAETGYNNKLPSRADIEFYETLSDYEKRIINDSTVHPMKLLDIARGLKEIDRGRLLSKYNEISAKTNSVEDVINEATIPGYCLFRDTVFSSYSRQLKFFFYIQNASEKGNELIKYLAEKETTIPPSLSQIRQDYNVNIAKENITEEQKQALSEKKKEDEFTAFADIMIRNQVFPQELLDEYVNTENSFSVFLNKLMIYYKNIFENEFASACEQHYSNSEYFEIDFIIEFAKKMYKAPVPSFIAKADELFKKMYHGHSPRVLSEYMYAQFFIKGITPHKVTEEELQTIVNEFDQKNISKVAKYKSSVLFALSTMLNYNEMKEDYIQALAIHIQPMELVSMNKRGFIDWYKAHKDTTLSDLVELLNMQSQISFFNITKSARDLIDDILYGRGKADCKLMERKYNYSFKDNEVAIRGRHIVAQDGRMKMYMLDKTDYRNFTVGYDTHCCQHHNGAGETCVYKLTTDPFAGCVIIERDGQILAQGFVWTDEVLDTLVFDNVEFANDRTVSQFSSLFAAWARAMPYKHIHVGTGYNPKMRAWGKATTFQAKMPRTLVDSYTYSDYDNSARSIKCNGVIQIKEQNVVKIKRTPDEPTKWDVIARPETAFLLNITMSLQERLDFAKEFLENPTPEVQMKAVQYNLDAIKYIENPTEEVQLYVVRKDKKIATFINNPCRTVQSILLDEDPNYFRKIQNPSEELILLVLERNGLLLNEVENPTEKMKKVAVEQNGYAIRFIHNPSEELQLIAVQNTPKVIAALQSPTEDVLRTAINADPTVVSLIDRISDSLQVLAIERDPYLINNISNPAYSAIKRAVELNGLLIRNFQYTYPHLRNVALQQNGFAISTLKNPTTEEYLIAIRQNPNVINSIRDVQLRAALSEQINQLDQTQDREEIEFE